ncbi:putative isocitrate dehydrogenase, NAD-dependent [Myxococcus xanthus DK 1622]|uniref:Isocitrate dehydrogenase, NAD-dependent n=1 Tax=Myxococcus xanthus (strain DK1622) TaxID=246197 RepID=Q1CYR1_MYXXD|nr:MULTISPECIES: isocitrate dehydrogenase (NAD(+)) [Myxococcus]ABF86223.1 putative isocitrate dehydrogenase, NAD-dependent [Myxococcus xanthus DK 1622]NOJ52446.1 isocitrate dehydrogenase (NAD(+)) [Myxococcus xanthus]QPM78687.1 isocitrate dehydrogenase (NAD(+)) [Myxococcus xanthus]QVW67757.1 isocitrate dehydrogenase (NAD(+)) [Myxococcus xanthus DZ2]QZZ53962.1 Isocitrate dehydrogenase [NADP] [Myxococcus xanthus]
MATTRTVTIINGDGIGPEVMAATVRVLEALKVPLDFEYKDAGTEVVAKYGTNLPHETVEAVLRSGIALKGPTGTVVGGGLPSANVGLRKRLDLYSSLRPVKSVPNVKTRYEGVDLVVVRENTESLYAGLEHIIVPGVVESLKIITEKASTRIARFAFEYARKHGRKKVTAVHKANIMKLSDGLFLDCCRKVGREFPDVTYEEVIIDNLAMQLVKDPTRFDVLVAENFYGDVLSDLCAGLVGGLGVVPGANIGERTAVFEAVHGTAPDIAGKGIANPTALMMSAVMMLDHLELGEAARRMENAIWKVYGSGEVRTGDLGGKATTREFTDAIIGAL